MQRTPAGLPCGIPGIAEEIDGATQQAPQPERQVATVMVIVVAQNTSLFENGLRLCQLQQAHRHEWVISKNGEHKLEFSNH